MKKIHFLKKLKRNIVIETQMGEFTGLIA